jgi:hypothetical protein
MNTEIHTDGNWALTACPGFGFGYYLRHSCEGHVRYGHAWCEYSYFRHSCPICHEYPPDGLQAMFLFLTDHMEDLL